MACAHMNFDVHAEVARLTDENSTRVKAFTMDLTVSCRECGMQFEFIGLPGGFSVYQPSCNITGRTAHLPIMPPGCPPDPGMPGYRVEINTKAPSTVDIQ